MPAARPFRRSLAVLAVAPLALGLVACGGDDDDNDDLARPSETVTVTEDATSPSSSPSTSSSQGAGGGGGELLTAAETALAELSGATLVSIDIDDNGGWDVTLLAQDGNESEVEVSADGTSVTRGPVSDDNDADDAAERRRLLEAQVGYLDAIETARGEITDLDVTGAELDEDGDDGSGTLRWDIDFGDGSNDDLRTVLVDAGSGAVIGTETDD